MSNKFKALLSVAGIVMVTACNPAISLSDKAFLDQAEEMARTQSGTTLETMGPPERPIDVAVYAFPDLTGQNEPNENYAEFSRAVTQGGADILIDVLTSAGYGKWFNVIERSRVDSLLRERAIIEQTQAAFTGGVSIPPLRFAGTLIEGSIVGYDTNTVTGGNAIRFLGIGHFQEYRQDVVTVALRAVSVSTGRVLTSVTTTKTIYSVKLQNDVFRFVTSDELIEYESGFSRNEPEIFAVREAMELAVTAMILEGAEAGHWKFADPQVGQFLIDEYKNRFKTARLGEQP